MKSSSHIRVVWFSEIKWTYIKNRHQQLIENFPPGWEVLFIETYVLGKANAYRPMTDGRVTYVTVPFLKGTPYPMINRMQGLAPVRWAMTFTAWLWVKIVFVLTGFATRRRTFIVSNIFFAPVIRFLRKERTVYDCNDYPMGFPGALPLAEKYFARMIRAADAVACVSERLRQDVLAYRSDHVSVIGNGVDLVLFESAKGQAAPTDVATLPRPMILYAGAISEWFNLDLVIEIARRHPSASVVMVGPILTPQIRNRLGETSSLQNMYFLGPKPHRELPAYIYQAAVCLIPFRKDPLIARFNPNKLYEYLACGKPVVTLDYTVEIERLRDLVCVAADDEEFLSMVAEALRSTPDSERLVALARVHSWKSKAKAMTQLILERE